MLPIEIAESKIEMEKALLELQSAWNHCVDAFNSAYVDANEYIEELYPFTESFDDIPINDWINNSISNLNKKDFLPNCNKYIGMNFRKWCALDEEDTRKMIIVLKGNFGIYNFTSDEKITYMDMTMLRHSTITEIILLNNVWHIKLEL